LILHLNQAQVHVLWQGALACNGQQAVTLCALRPTLNQQVLPSLQAERSQKHLPVCVSAGSHFCHLPAVCKFSLQAAPARIESFEGCFLYSPHVSHQRCARQTAVDRQDLSRTYLAHHELERDFIILLLLLHPFGAMHAIRQQLCTRLQHSLQCIQPCRTPWTIHKATLTPLVLIRLQMHTTDVAIKVKNVLSYLHELNPS